MKNPRFFTSSDKRIVVCEIISKGEVFKGTAKCMETDTPDLELGKKLAQCRANLKVRKRDLSEIRLVIACLKGAVQELDETQSKLWSHYLQDACKAEKNFLKHTRNLKAQIKNLCNES